MFGILNKTKQQQKVETRYWSIVSLKHILSAAENLEWREFARFGTGNTRWSSFKKGFYLLHIVILRIYVYSKKPDSLTCFLSSFIIYEVNIIWIFYIVYLLRIQFCKYFHCYLLTSVYKTFPTVSENMIHLKTFVKNNCLTNFLFLYPVSNSWLSFFMESLLSFAFCAPWMHVLSSLFNILNPLNILLTSVSSQSSSVTDS